ncbi:hypothetical protein COUCH_25040 [Couchioplanes caeruleus]|uniref:hypothetical protein n=1 Tax=Couchioplanes caeruleus TaxID=56438 RepID=UPI0020BFED0D|nr:hypothetical protein [Couchioplanes caeruleus]UQU62292.1 hypothetical protein COUCH_25040 [Couchioplanes caeruleus]
MAIVVGLLCAVVGATVGALVTYLSTRSTMRLTLEHTYDQNLQSKRLERYQELFHVSRCLPRYFLPGEEPDRMELLAFRETFSAWYFGEKGGGMFLTPASQELSLRLLNLLVEIGSDDAGSPRLRAAESRQVRELAGELRHQLAEDVGASHPPGLRWTRPGKTSPPPPGIAE